MTRIIYERDDNTIGNAHVIMKGSGPDLLRGVVQICYTLQDQIGVDVHKLAEALPLMVKLEAESMAGTTAIDLSAIMKEGGK